MDKPTFTPEPWVAVHRGTRSDIKAGRDYYRIGTAFDVADPDAQCIHVHGPHREAKAYLIAATPELLDALSVLNVFLKVIADEFDLDDDTCIGVRIKKGDGTGREVANITLKDAFSKASAALAKARGEANA